MKRIKQKLNSNDGITLIELMVSTGILLMVLLILGVGIITAFDITARSQRVESAGLAGAQLLEGAELSEEGGAPSGVTVSQTDGTLSFRLDGLDYELPITVNGVSVPANDEPVVVYQIENGSGIGSEEMPAKAADFLNEFFSNNDAWRRENYGQTWMNNDKFREWFRDQDYGGSWPPLSVELLEKNGLGRMVDDNYVVQPFVAASTINAGRDDGYQVQPTDIVIFALQANQNGWYACFVYNQYDRHWYFNPKRASINSERFVGASIQKELADTSVWRRLEY